MSFIQIAYTDDRTIYRLTTGKVIVTVREERLLLYNTESKKEKTTSEKEAVSIKLERIGKYKLVVHTFNYGPDHLDPQYLIFTLLLGSCDLNKCTHAKWNDHEHKLGNDNPAKQWIESTQYIFIHSPMELNLFSTRYEVPDTAHEIAFFIIVEFMS